MKRSISILISIVLLAPALAAQSAPGARSVIAAVRSYRLAHEPQIIREFDGLLSIPNTASDEPNIQRNAAHLAEMLNSRGFHTELLPISGRGPVVFAELAAPGAKRTVIFILPL